jgi:hypothetical protein
VAIDPELRPPGKDPSQALQLAVGELYDQAATVAHQVVAMVSREAGIVAVPMLHVDVLDQVELFQNIHRAVDAGQADPGVNLLGAPMHLRYFHVLGAGGQHLQDRHAGPSYPKTVGLQRLP